MRLFQRGKRGIWWVDVTIGGERLTRSTGTTHRAAAQEWAAKLAHDTWRHRKLGDAPAVTWGAAVLDWLNKHGDERRSIETIKDRLRWITARIETVPLAQITATTIEGLVKEKRTEGASATTCNRYISEASKILHHAHRMGWVAGVPALRRAAEPKGKVRWLTPAEALKLIAELPPHLADMARFSLATGLRESNVRLLRWDQIDLDRQLAWIEGADMKTGKPLNVPLNSDAIDVLRRRRGDHERYVFVWRPPVKKGSNETPAAHVVTCCSTLAWYKATKRAGLAGLRWHDLRHTWASWHVQNETPLPALQQLGGWASYSMVLRYAHLGRDHVAAYASGSLLRDKSATTFSDEARENSQGIEKMGWLMGLEPTTTGITTPRTKAKVLNLKDALTPKRRKAA